MVDQKRVQQHYSTRNELLQILHEDAQRKDLIKQAILQVVANSYFNPPKMSPRASRALNRSSPKVSPTKSRAQPTAEETNEFEVRINNLKLEHSTRSKLQETKIEALKDENIKLKEQIKSLREATIKAPPVNSIFISRQPTSSQTLWSKTTTLKSSSLFNPNSIFDSVMTPIKKPGLKFNRSFKSKSPQSDSTVTMVNSAMPSSPSLGSSAPVTTPSKFISNFERSENDGSSSPEFTPRRTSTIDKIKESSQQPGSPKNGDSKKKVTKLVLNKSTVTTNTTTINGLAAHGLDDDDLNPLKFYEDSNFEHPKSSPTVSKRHLDDDDDRPTKKPKKDKNVFSIE
ncbi:hypothetical protein G210_0649 [Candida maltosa Xu316]|uniref:Uncharacterized protein n=1 Tax=Candida maltosa (strain Xu316) TaxID=1245528 RepID=M3K0B6_CANMX|nr:hypothetical protein G210_0649 [Candida maltosa Xu316]